MLLDKDLEWTTKTMTEKIREIIHQTVMEMLNQSISASNVNRLVKTHRKKVHFVPLRYRVIGGILQGLNIKFGNFIETLIQNLVEIDPGVEVMQDSGEKIRLTFTPETDSMIDAYITDRQLPNSPDDCTDLFHELLRNIIEIEQSAVPKQRQGIVKDVDGLFRTQDGMMVYTELKYNDDHDTGKFADINRKFIKTWAGLAVRLGITKPDELVPVLYYFNPTKRYGPIHVPSRNIMRGAQLFDEFLQIDYSVVDEYLRSIGDEPEILKLFDEMYNRVRFGDID